MFSQMTFNPTHFQKPVDIFLTTSWSHAEGFSIRFDVRKSKRKKKKRKSSIFLANHITLSIFQFDKVFSKRSKQAEYVNEISMTSEGGGRFGEEAPLQPVRQTNLRTMGQNIRFPLSNSCFYFNFEFCFLLDFRQVSMTSSPFSHIHSTSVCW